MDTSHIIDSAPTFVMIPRDTLDEIVETIREIRRRIGADVPAAAGSAFYTLDTRIYDLPLSVRILNCLNAHGIETLGDITNHDRSDFLLMRGLGMKAFRCLNDFMVSQKLWTK